MNDDRTPVGDGYPLILTNVHEQAGTGIFNVDVDLISDQMLTDLGRRDDVGMA